MFRCVRDPIQPTNPKATYSSVPAPAPTPTAEDLAKLEADKVKLDRATANEGPNRYLAAGLVTIANSLLGCEFLCTSLALYYIPIRAYR